MRDGPYELVLRERTPEGKLLREEDIKGEAVVHGDRGGEFVVCVNIFRDSKSHKWPARKLRVGLHVDGQDVQYWNRVDLPEKLPVQVDYVTVIFEGFKKNTKDLRSFKFGTPDLKLPSARNYSSVIPSSSKVKVDDLGKIRASIYTVSTASKVAVVQNQSRFHEVPTHSLTGTEKKAKDQPSLVTVSGQGVVEEPGRFPDELMTWNAASNPTAVLTITYHTQSWARLKRKLVELE